MRYNLAFYTKYKIKVTKEAVIKIPVSAEERALEKKYLQMSNYPKSINKDIIQKLERDIERFPNNPKLQNYLANFYKLIGNKIMYERILKATRATFPDYVFGKVTLAFYYSEEAKWAELNEILGESRNISDFEPYEYIHESLLFSYYKSCIDYEIAQTNFDEAKKYLRILFDYEPKSEDVRDFAFILETKRLIHSFSNSTKKARELEFKPYFAEHLTPTEEIPAFYHPEINKFYEIPYNDTPITFIDGIIALPRKTLIEDLEAVILDSIRRFEFIEGQTDALIHAIFFLGALKSTQSLPVIFDLMRQDQEYCDFYFGDFKNKFFLPTLYYLGENQLDALLAFAKEPNRNIYFISDVSSIVSQIVLHQPKRRAEVLAFHKNLLRFFIENQANDAFIDSNLLGFIVADLIDYRATEFLDEIKILFDLNIVDHNIAGNFEEVNKEITKAYHESEIDPLPLNIYEFYDFSYEKRKVNMPDEERAFYDKILNPTDPYEKFFQKISLDIIAKTFTGGKHGFDDNFDDDEAGHYVPQAPVKRLVSKVGRNEKCPCGSGSKYKNCCGK